MNYLRKIIAYLDTPLGVKGYIVKLECGHTRHDYTRLNGTVAACHKCPKEDPANCRSCGTPFNNADAPPGRQCVACTGLVSWA